MVEIVFLGTGGGRVNLIFQKRRTAGFRINGSLKIHVDPGPGTLAACKQFGQDPRKTDALVVTHNHIDHVNDASLIAEAMSNYALSKNGFLVASKSVIDGDENGDRGISRYHQSKIAHVHAAKPGLPINLSGKAGKSAIVYPTKVEHNDPTGFGFVLKIDGKSIGYTSDTEYFPGLSEQFEGCDLLIANVIKPAKDSLDGHLHSQTAARLFSEAKPKMAVITHIGMKLMKAGPEKEAARISKASGIPTIAASDGMRLKIGRRISAYPYKPENQHHYPK
ncbi:MAG: MBL fold metallo-hydrolase [Candidatus Micrarchaeota archaeon]|nr:MBL fold metallo-hydrolase [Candidatus Micrarchaeota archaeon]